MCVCVCVCVCVCLCVHVCVHFVDEGELNTYVYACLSCMYNLWYKFSIFNFLKRWQQTKQMYSSTKQAANPASPISLLFGRDIRNEGLECCCRIQTDNKHCLALTDWFVSLLASLFVCLFVPVLTKQLQSIKVIFKNLIWFFRAD